MVVNIYRFMFSVIYYIMNIDWFNGGEYLPVYV